jgi:hypothetical protein
VEPAWPSARQGTKQVVIGMGLEEFFDPFAVESKLFFNRKKHFHETQGQHAFGGLGASRLFS